MSSDEESGEWDGAWLRLRQHGERLLQLEDQTLFTEIWEEYYIAVTKEGSFLRLWMMEQSAPNTDWVQSALFLPDPLRLVLSYSQAMCLALTWPGEKNAIYMSGLGGGCMANVLSYHLPEAHLDCVEIAPPVARAARDFFAFETGEQIKLEIGDGAQALSRRDDGSFDLLMLDLFTDAGRTPEHLTGPGFISLCRQKVAEEGIVVMNLGADEPTYGPTLDAFVEHFQFVYVCPGKGATHVLFATNSAPFSFDNAQRAIQTYRFHFPLESWVERMQTARPGTTVT